MQQQVYHIIRDILSFNLNQIPLPVQLFRIKKSTDFRDTASSKNSPTKKGLPSVLSDTTCGNSIKTVM